MNKKRILAGVSCALVLVLLGIAAWYWYQGEHYVGTEDAGVAADLVAVGPEIGGRIVEWKVKEGDRVGAGEVLGRQDLGTVLSTGIINASTLGTIGSVAAEKAVIKTPIAGQVIRSSAVVGQMALPGNSLAVVANTDELFVSANIEGGRIGRIRLGQAVEMGIEGFPGAVFKGRVETIGLATASTFSLLPVQNSGGNYTRVTQIVPVKIQLLDSLGKTLLVGMNASIRILLDSTPATKDTL